MNNRFHLFPSHCLFILLLLTLNTGFAQDEKTTPVITDKVKVADWYGFSKAAYSLSFDDGLLSHYKYVAPILDEYGFKATFYIVTENLQSDSLSNPIWRYGYWHQFINLSQKGHEIASHSATHPKLSTLPDGNPKAIGSLQNELNAPIKTLQKKIPGYKAITFAYPFVDFNDHVKEETAKLYVSSRGLGSGFNSAHPSEWMNLQAHTLSYTSERTPASDLEKIMTLENWIQNNTIAKKGWTIFLAHDVLPFLELQSATDSWHPVSSESIDFFAHWLEEKRDNKELWIETVGKVTCYIKERDAVSIRLLEETPDKITLSISDGLPDDLFNVPLTLEIKVPTTWKKVTAIQKETKNTVDAVNGKIILNAIPDLGNIELRKQE